MKKVSHEHDETVFEAGNEARVGLFRRGQSMIIRLLSGSTADPSAPHTMTMIDRLGRNPLWRVRRLRDQLAQIWAAVQSPRREAARLARLEQHRNDMIRRYLDSGDVRKLQLGSWENVLDGWLSTDLNPPDDRVAYLDATRRFPLPDASFDYIYSEHMIEHVAHADGVRMLGECRRVLRPGGRIRIATPDLRSVAGLCADELTGEQQRYLEWATQTFFPTRRRASASIVVNNLFRAWGHQFLYDEPTLGESLIEAGFVGVVRCQVQESEDPHLCGIEHHGRHIGEDNNRFETMILEAQRPA